MLIICTKCLDNRNGPVLWWTFTLLKMPQRSFSSSKLNILTLIFFICLKLKSFYRYVYFVTRSLKKVKTFCYTYTSIISTIFLLFYNFTYKMFLYIYYFKDSIIGWYASVSYQTMFFFNYNSFIIWNLSYDCHKVFLCVCFFLYTDILSIS